VDKMTGITEEYARNFRRNINTNKQEVAS
jgi:hypothetical protein